MQPFKLRGYQKVMYRDILRAWSDGTQNICGVLPTGAGKTVVFSTVVAQHPGESLVSAHRQELVGQMSCSLARTGVTHSIIAPSGTVEWIVRTHIKKYGRPFYDPNAPCAVASVDTLLARRKKPWVANKLRKTSLWVMDECHHILRENKWGKIVELLTHAKGLGVTATPERADRKGLGRHADGVFDTMVIGPSTRDLIDRGYLTDYRIVCPPSNMDQSTLRFSQATGDFTRNSIAKAVRQSSIIGDVVLHYLKWAPGKTGVTFVPDVRTAYDIAEYFNAAGVPAEAVHAGTPNAERQSSIDRIETGDLKQLVNVDLFGEGFDLPAIEVISMARSTASLKVYLQQFGRVLRIMPGKTEGLVIDHVGNILNPLLGGPPDTPREWSLDSRKKRKTTDPVVRITVCPKCTGAYRRLLRACPYCGFQPKPAQRSSPEFVDGDLVELDPAVLAKMRGDADAAVDPESYAASTLEYAGAPLGAILGARKQHGLRRAAQLKLRETIAVWAALQRQRGRPDSESYRRFYHTWGVDVMTAQALKRQQTIELTEKIRKEL